MTFSHSRALIVAVVTESVIVTSFIPARASEGVFPQALCPRGITTARQTR